MPGSIEAVQSELAGYADALKIVLDRRYEFSTNKQNVPVLWDKLYRVGRYIEQRQKDVVAAILQEAL